MVGVEARLSAYVAYRPSGIHEGPALLLRARPPIEDLDPAQEWRKLVRELAVEDLDTTHYELFLEPAVDRVAALLDGALQKLQDDARPLAG